MRQHVKSSARRVALAVALVAMTLVGRSTALAAQAAVTGAVRDSLAGAPLAGARVELVSAADPSAGRRAIETDAEGRYRIDDVAPGRYLIGFLHQRLDVLGLQIELPPVEVHRADTLVRVDLAVPGARSMSHVVCGVRADSSAVGLLMGRVVRAETREAADRGRVTARWRELLVSRNGAQWRDREITAEADDAGRFVACGLPTNVPLAILATSGTTRSGEVELIVPETGVLERDLLIAEPMAASDSAPSGVASVALVQPAPARRYARLTGHVRREARDERVSAQVAIRGSDGAERMAVTDADGAFALDELPAGTRMLEVRAIGYQPKHVVVDLVAGETTALDVVLDNHVPVLDTLRVRAREPERDWTGFTERSRGPFGSFMNEARIKSMRLTTATDLLRTMPGVQIIPTVSARGGIITTRGANLFNTPCMPDVYVDGVQVPDGAASLDLYARPTELVGIELYVDMASVPVQYHRGACGAVVVWTRNRPSPAAHPSR
ncbi:MAG: carboxypeptidase regulatory-like domain-containing protein [bacterium]